MHGSVVPAAFDLPPGARAAVECQVGSWLVDRVAVYGFMAHDEMEDGDQTYLDRAAVAYLDRMVGRASSGVRRLRRRDSAGRVVDGVPTPTPTARTSISKSTTKVGRTPSIVMAAS